MAFVAPWLRPRDPPVGRVGRGDDEDSTLGRFSETIRSARTLEFSLPIRRMPSLRTSAGPTFLGCLRRRTSLIVLPSQTGIKVLRRLGVFVF